MIKSLPILLIPSSNLGGSNILLSSLVSSNLKDIGYTNVKTLDWAMIKDLRMMDIERVMSVVYSPTPDPTLAEVRLLNAIAASSAVLFFAPYYNGYLPGNTKLIMDWASLRQPQGGSVLLDKVSDIMTITSQKEDANSVNDMHTQFHNIMKKATSDMGGKYVPVGSAPIAIFGNVNPDDPTAPGPYTDALQNSKIDTKEFIYMEQIVKKYVLDFNSTMHKHILPTKEGLWSCRYDVH